MRAPSLSVVVALWGVACGSSESSDIFERGGGAPATGGASATGGSTESGGTPATGGSIGNTGGSSETGGTPSAGGSVPSGGASAAGAGGTIPAGGAATGGTLGTLGGSGGAASGGTPGQFDDAGTPLESIPVGIYVPQTCSDCIDASCPTESQTCLADPTCAQALQCLADAILPVQLAPCFVAGLSSPPLVNLNTCSAANCPTCPAFNTGG